MTTATDDTADDDVIDTGIPEIRASPPKDVAIVTPTSAMRSALAADRRRAAPADTVTRQAAPDATAALAIAERVLREERERVVGISDVARKLGVETTVAEDLVRRGVGLDEARRLLIDQVAGRVAWTRSPPAKLPSRMRSCTASIRAARHSPSQPATGAASA